MSPTAAGKPVARIVLATLGSLGDLHPMMALGLELQRRGHAIVIATTEFYRRKVEAAGLSFRPLRPEASPQDPELMRAVMDARKGPEFSVRRVLLPHLGETYTDLMTAAQGADFLLAGEIVFAAPLVAEKLRLRWASVILSPSSFLSVHDPSIIAPLPFTRHLLSAPPPVHRAILAAGKYMARDWGAPIGDLRSTLGLRPSAQPLFEDKFSTHLNLAMFSKVLAEPQPDWPASTVQTGFVFYDRQALDADSPRGLRHFLDAGTAPIIFTLGSAAVYDAGEFYERSAAAARSIGMRALLLIGNNSPPADLSTGIAAFDYAPYSEVFPRAACIVHQGGVGTSAQALKAGRPQLVMPYAFDQPDNAVRMERLGVARVIERKRYTAARAASELRTILTTKSYAERAAEIGACVQAENGLNVACDAIEAALGRM